MSLRTGLLCIDNLEAIELLTVDNKFQHMPAAVVMCFLTHGFCFESATNALVSFIHLLQVKVLDLK